MGWLRDRAQRFLPVPSLAPDARVPRRDIRRIIVFARVPNPTFDYYLKARMAAIGNVPCSFVDIREMAAGDPDPEGAFVIICRYMSRDLINWIERNRVRLAGVGYFTDDDVSGFVSSGDADLGYRFFLFWLGLWPLRRLNRVLDILWVSTPALANRFAEAKPVLMPPAPPAEFWLHDGSRDPTEPVKIVFHSKAIHETEHRFLVPVVKEVLARRPAVVVEISAAGRSLAHWRAMPGVTIIDEVPWPVYVEHSRSVGADIVLVPLLSTPVNDLRADTKRIDVARFGAAGLFSKSATYGYAAEGDEMLVENDADAWITAIIRLIDNPQARLRTAEATRMRVAAMSARADQRFPGLEI